MDVNVKNLDEILLSETEFYDLVLKNNNKDIDKCIQYQKDISIFKEMGFRIKYVLNLKQGNFYYIVLSKDKIGFYLG